jgi:hypothetical protein
MLTPLMAWWALLYGLSILARYHPGVWVAALDVDDTQLAVAIDNALEAALDALPHLVLDAITTDSMLLWG